MKKFILIMAFSMLLGAMPSAFAQAVYGPNTACITEMATNPALGNYGVTYYTVNHPLLCDYCNNPNRFYPTIQSGVSQEDLRLEVLRLFPVIAVLLEQLLIEQVYLK